MKKLLISSFCLSLMFSSVCLAEKRSKQNSNSQTAVNASFPNPFRPIIDVFKKILGIKTKAIYGCGVAEINNLQLDKIEYILGKSESIQVYAYAANPNNEPYEYRYTVSGGKIIGQGEKIAWDLSDAKGGAYTIKAEVNNGCDFCGRSITKTVIVKECPDCK